MSRWPFGEACLGNVAGNAAPPAGAAARAPRPAHGVAALGRARGSGKLKAPPDSQEVVYQGRRATFCKWYVASPTWATNPLDEGRLFLGLVSVGSRRK